VLFLFWLASKKQKALFIFGQGPKVNRSLPFPDFYFAERSEEGLFCFDDSSAKENNVMVLSASIRENPRLILSFFDFPFTIFSKAVCQYSNETM